jgi:hypothetical protein
VPSLCYFCRGFAGRPESEEGFALTYWEAAQDLVLACEAEDAQVGIAMGFQKSAVEKFLEDARSATT